MAIQTREKMINGRKVLVTQYPGLTALINKTKILTLVGPGLSQSGIKELSGGTDKLDVFISIVGGIVSKLAPEQFSSFVLELLRCTRISCDGGNLREITKEVFDTEFSGNLLLMYKTLFFTLEVNYGDFFGDGGIGKILKRTSRSIPPEPAKE